jgi:hypothetical protein
MRAAQKGKIMKVENLRLGKGEYVHDERTPMLARFFRSTVRVPTNWDFDHGRAPFPLRVWGNDAWGDCVIGGEANHTLRLERVEQRGTIKLADEDAVNRYMALSGAKSPGDANDNGLVVLEANRDWRNNGFLTKTGRVYKIAAYGELEPTDRQQLRTASYLLHGIHFGFWLPTAAQAMTNQGVWDYKGETGPEWRPGSWGGHLVYSKKFDADSHEVLSWGMKIRVTNAFIERYADEAWAVVDNLDSWKTKQTIDVPKLEKTLSEITAKVDQ